MSIQHPDKIDGPIFITNTTRQKERKNLTFICQDKTKENYSHSYSSDDENDSYNNDVHDSGRFITGGEKNDNTNHYEQYLSEKPASFSVTSVQKPIPDIAAAIHVNKKLKINGSILDNQKLNPKRLDDDSESAFPGSNNSLTDFSKKNLKPPAKPDPHKKRDLVNEEVEQFKYTIRRKIMMNFHLMSLPIFKFVSKFCAKIGRLGAGSENEFIKIYPQHFFVIFSMISIRLSRTIPNK